MQAEFGLVWIIVGPEHCLKRKVSQIPEVVLILQELEARPITIVILEPTFTMGGVGLECFDWISTHYKYSPNLSDVAYFHLQTRGYRYPHTGAV